MRMLALDKATHPTGEAVRRDEMDPGWMWPISREEAARSIECLDRETSSVAVPWRHLGNEARSIGCNRAEYRRLQPCRSS
jgi:hypothetical protein